MPRRKAVATIDVSGLSVNDILNIDPEVINKMNVKDLKRITSRLVSAGNKRIRRLGKSESGKMSPAYQQFEKRGSRMFSVKNKTLAQVRNTFANVKQFLGYKTSTVKGWHEVKRKIEERLGVNEEQSKKIWELYRKAQEQEKGIINNVITSDRIQQMIRDEVVNSNDDGLDERIFNNLNKLYEETKKQDVESLETDGVVDVFDYDYDF